MHLQLQPDGFALEISGVQWLFQDLAGVLYNAVLSVAVSPEGELLALENHAGEYLVVCRFHSFRDMAEGRPIGGDRSDWELPNRLLLEVAHKLGIAEFQGEPVDRWFRDEEEIYAAEP